MGAPRVTPAEFAEMHRLYNELGNAAEVARRMGRSASTVRKYIRQLEERGLIVTGPTQVITKAGEKRNGNLLFTLWPIHEVIDQYYDHQLEELELATERQRVAKLLREQESPA